MVAVQEKSGFLVGELLYGFAVLYTQPVAEFHAEITYRRCKQPVHDERARFPDGIFGDVFVLGVYFFLFYLTVASCKIVVKLVRIDESFASHSLFFSFAHLYIFIVPQKNKLPLNKSESFFALVFYNE